MVFCYPTPLHVFTNAFHKHHHQHIIPVLWNLHCTCRAVVESPVFIQAYKSLCLYKYVYVNDYVCISNAFRIHNPLKLELYCGCFSHSKCPMEDWSRLLIVIYTLAGSLHLWPGKFFWLFSPSTIQLMFSPFLETSISWHDSLNSDCLCVTQALPEFVDLPWELNSCAEVPQHIICW